IQKASEATKANRVLASSAVEAGLSYKELSDKNAEFATKAGLSNLAATGLTARITQLAVAANKPGDISKLQKGFLDLGTARGIEAKDLEILVQQIITGQDEGYKKLLLPNPRQLQAEYARKVGRTTSSLTAVENLQIFLNKASEKSNLFNGTAEARLASIDGQAAKLTASFQNLGVSLATAFSSNADVAVTIDNITTSIKQLTGSLDELYKKQKLGVPLTDQEIKDVSAPGAISDAKKLAALVGLIAGKATSILGFFDSDVHGFGENLTDYSAATLTERTSDLNEYVVRQRLNAQKVLDSKQEENRKEAAEFQKRLQAEEEAKRVSGIKERQFEKTFASSRTSIDDLRTIRDSFTFDPTTEDYKGPLFADKNSQFYEKAFRAVSSRVEKQFRFILSDPASTEQILRQALQQIETNKDLGEEDQDKLIQDFQKGIIEAVARKFNKLLSNPKLNVASLNAAIRSIEGDRTLTPDKKEDLLQSAEQKLEGFGKKLKDLKEDFRDLLVNSVDDNQLLKVLLDVNKAFDDTLTKFTPLGEGFAKTAAEIAKANAQKVLGKIAFESSDRALQFRQEARRLEQIPEEQVNGFSRRLDEVEKRVNFSTTDFQLKKLEEEAIFFAERYNPQQTDKTLLLEKFGYGGLDKLTQDFQAPGRNRNEGGIEYQQRVNAEREKYFQTSLRIKETFEEIESLRSIDLNDTGLYGQEARAKALLDRLPSREELLPRLQSFGRTKEEAQQLLRERADAQIIVRQANRKRFDDFIANQRFTDLNRKDAEERVKNLGVNGNGLSNKEQLNQFLNIVNELGTSELTPQLRTAKIRTLNAKAEIEEKQRVVAEQQMLTISQVLTTIQSQLEAQGIKVTLGETPLVEVTIDNNGRAQLDARPDRNSVRSGR
ncbi:MAG: hypothetical protein WBP82_00700, partial [Leuconostoc mesenteroides]